jgi:predicted ABC-type ATPase
LHTPPPLPFKNHGGDLLETAIGCALPVKKHGGAVEYKTAFGSTLLEPVDVLEMKTALAEAVVETHTENDGTEGIVEAYVAVTGTRDEVGDVIEHSAFDRTLKTLRPKMCLGHDWNRPIGEPVEIRVLLPGDPDLPGETADGQPWPAEAGALYTKNRYMLGTKDGCDAYEHAKFYKGRTAYSIGYVVRRKRHGFHNGLKTRFIQDLDLYEYGPVLHGAHPHATQKSVKTGEPDGVEHKVRKVHDAHYWGYPVGTPITANMKPKGPTARKIRKEGKIPDRQQGTTDAVTAAGKPAPKRTTPGKATAAADAGGLFPEPESDARVRARNPKGKDDEHVGKLIEAFDDTQAPGETEQEITQSLEKQRREAYNGLLDEGITPQELESDLRGAPKPDSFDDAEWNEHISDAVAEYGLAYKRENRRQQGTDKGSTGDNTTTPAEGAGDTAAGGSGKPGGANDAATPPPPTGDGGGSPAGGSADASGRSKAEPDAEASSAAGNLSPLAQQIADDINASPPSDYIGNRVADAAGQGPQGNAMRAVATMLHPRNAKKKRADPQRAGERQARNFPDDAAESADAYDAIADALESLGHGNDGDKGDGYGGISEFLHGMAAGIRGDSSDAEAPAEPDPTTAAMWKADPARAAERLPEAARTEHSNLTPGRQDGYASARGAGDDHAAALEKAGAAPEAGADNVPDTGVDNSGTETGEPAGPPLPAGDETADTPADNAPAPGAPAEKPRVGDTLDVEAVMPEGVNDVSEAPWFRPGQSLKFGDKKIEQLPISSLLRTQDNANTLGDKKVEANTSDEPVNVVRYQGKDWLFDGHHRVVGALAADRTDIPARVYDMDAQDLGVEGGDANAPGVPDAGTPDGLPEPPAQLTPEEQAWADDPAAAATAQLDEEQRTEYDALDEQGKHSYATARIAGENHDDALAYAQHRSATTAPAAAEGAPDATTTPPAPGELRPTGAEANPDNLANTIATYGAKVDLSKYDTDMLKATDAEFTRRAGLLGKPDTITKNHQVLKDEIARREQTGETGAAPDAGLPAAPSELPASPNLGVAPGGDGATEPAADLAGAAPDANELAIPGADVTAPGETVQSPTQQGPSQAEEAARDLAPERTAQITADEIAEVNTAADASFGVEEADDGVFEVDQDVADRQERVAALLDADEAGGLDLGSRTDDGLRDTRADVVNELKLQDHLTARERNAPAPTRAQRSGTGASGGDGSGDPEAEPAVDPGPKVRPGVAGALEDLADAIEGDDQDEFLRARARLESSLKRSRSDSEVVAAVRAVIESTDMPDPALLRAAAERLRAEAREHRNSQARSRRAARRFERDRLRSLLGSVDAEMRRRNLAYDPVPGLDGDADTTAPAAGGPTPGTWTSKPGLFGSGEVSTVQGANYSGRIDTYAGGTQPRYSWSVTGDDGTELASGSGVLDDPAVARTAIAHALATQQTLGRIPADAVLPEPDGGNDAVARREIERSGTEGIRTRIGDPSVNPVTGLPNPLAPPARVAAPPVKVFDSPQAVRAYLDANTVHPNGTPNAAGPVRWDDVKLSPGGGLAVGTLADGTPTLFHAASGRSIPPYSNGQVVRMNKTDLMKLATYLESLTDDSGKNVDWGNPNSKEVGQAAMFDWKSPADGSSLIESATRAVVMDKLREGKWTDQTVRSARLKPVAGDGTNPTRRALIEDLQRSYGQLVNVRRGPVPAEDKKTMAVIHGAGQLSDAGAPDAAAVALRRRAGEIRQLAEDAHKAADGTPGNANLAARAEALETSAMHAGLLENLADAHLSMHSPAASPGTRVLRAQPGERLAFRDGENVKTYRFLTPMRASGSDRQGETSSYAQVIDESTGEQLTAGVIGGAGMRPQVQVFDPDQKVGVFTGSIHTSQLGGNGFVVLDADEPAPEPDGFRNAVLADLSAIPSGALDRAAEDLPETAAERTARQAAAPEGGRTPARRSQAAPRREAPPARRAPSTDEQKLAQAQTDGIGAWLDSPFELNDAPAPGGFADLDEVHKAADAALVNVPATDYAARASLSAIGTGTFEGYANQNQATNGAKLSPGGHLIVRADGQIVHARSGQIVWSPNGSWLTGKYAFEKPSPAQTMRIADYLERASIDGESMPWESPDTEKIKTALRSVMEKTKTNPVATATRMAVADHMAGVSRPTANDIANFDTLTLPADPVGRMPNPDVFAANLLKGQTEDTYARLSGKRTMDVGYDLPGTAPTKEGQNLAKRIAAEFALTRGQSKVAPLDAARRLDALADELDGRTIVTGDGKTFTPSDDLRARAQAVRDAYDPDKVSPLGQLGRASFDATLKINVSNADISVGTPISAYGARAEGGTRNIRTSRLKTELREGGSTIKLDRAESGRLRATLAGRTVEDGNGAVVRVNPDGSIEISWEEDLFGGAARPTVKLPNGAWKLDQQASTAPGSLTDAEYDEHTALIEKNLAAAFSDGQATDVVHTIGHDGQSWTLERAKLHNEIVNEMWTANGASVPTEGRAVIAGGLGGAGKSTVLKGYAGIDATQYFTINSDDVKEAMAARDMVPAVEGLSPMEASALVHVESGYVANLLAARAYANNTNVVWDTTMGSRKRIEQRIKELRSSGYTEISGVFVDIPVETSAERAATRHRQGMAEQGGLGGRYVPPSSIRSKTSDTSSSTNRDTFDALQPDFDSWVIYDNSVAGREPQKVAGSGTWA